MSRPLPPPPTTPPNPASVEFGNQQAAGTQGQVLPAPPQPPAPSAMEDVQDVHNIVMSVRSIADRHPQAVPIAKQINSLVQQLQMKIVQALPPAEVAAPPV